MKPAGIAAVAACLLVGCGGGRSRFDGSELGRDASLGADAAQETRGACSLGSDYLKCDGNDVLFCSCTKQGAYRGTDLAGLPMYDCDASAWVVSSVCSVACDATINTGSGCIASAQPVPACAEDGMACWNGNLTFCRNGYPLPTTPCADGTQCTPVPGCQALCLGPAEVTDPRCPPTPGFNNDFCLDNTAYHCACGYLIGTDACGAAPHECVAVPSYDSKTAVSGAFAMCGLPP